MRSKRAAVAGIFLGLLPVPTAWAWSHPGHMVVAAIAWSELNPDARAEAIRLLKLNPEWNQWIDGATPDEADAVGFIMAATWPDRIKLNHAYRDEDPRHPDDVPNLPTAAQNIGYADMFTHKYWHFIDMPYSPDGTVGTPAPAPNVATRIADFRTALADKSQPDSVRSYDLAWLEHLVGDVHQPLHAVTRFTASLPGDAGGNAIKLSASGASELHAFWDGLLGSKMPKPPFAPEAANALAAAKTIVSQHGAEAAQVQISDPAAWASESFDLAKSAAYSNPPVGTDAGPYTLDAAYKTNARSIAQTRVYLAGERLAALLNTTLGGPSR